MRGHWRSCSRRGRRLAPATRRLHRGYGNLDRIGRLRHHAKLVAQAADHHAWSAPGTALLVTLFPALPLNEAVGAYITAALIIFALGASGYFDLVIKRIPPGIASGMMAGILSQFTTGVFKAISVDPPSR